MIRSNLATRPFYNERAVHLVLGAFAVVAIAATVFNVTRVVQLSRRDTQLATQTTRDEAQAVELRQRADRLRATIDPRVLDAASADARQANDLIDRRTFSWTQLFNLFETTLPDDARITAVRPQLDPKRGIVVTVVLVAKGVEDVNRFVDNLEATGAFTQLEKKDENVDEENQLAATLEGVYMPAAARRAAEGAGR